MSLYLALMWLLSRVNQEVFLQVSQLSEVLTAGLTSEGALATMHTQVHLETVTRRKRWRETRGNRDDEGHGYP